MALEWDKTFAKACAANRSVLAQDLTVTWAPYYPSQLTLTELANALAWEPTIVQGVLPVAIRRLWLEWGKAGNLAHTTTFWHDRLVQYLPNPALLGNPAQCIETIARNAHVDGDQAFRAWPYEYERDHRWLGKLKKSIPVSQPGWTLLVVGYLHCTERDEHTLWSLMRAAGRNCRRVFPCFRPPPQWG